MTTLELLICVVLVLVSAFLSSSEIALFSLSRFQLRSLKERFRPGHRKIKRLLGDPGGLLITVLVVNELVNISLSAIIASAVSVTPKPGLERWAHLPAWAIDTLIGILVTAPILLIVCEVTPKVVGARANQLIATMTAGPLTLVYDLASPIRFVLKKLLSVVSRWAARIPGAEHTHKPGHEDRKPGTILRESDFLLMVEEGRKEGAIQESEFELIKNVFELDDTTVGEIFMPLSTVTSLSVDTALKAALQTIRGQKYSRIPVLGPNRREVAGILYAKDLMRAKLQSNLLEGTVAALMRKPLFVSPTMRLNALFRKFKQQKTHMAIVQAPSGQSLGIVTMSDVLDALFEDVLPDEDEEDDLL